MIIRRSLLHQGQYCFRRSAPAAGKRCISSQTTAVTPESTPIDPISSHALPEDKTAVGRQTRRSAQDFQEYQRQSSLLDTIGGEKTPTYAPHQLLNNPPRPEDVTLELLLASQSHFGHATALWNPSNSAYIFGVRDGIHIISLDVTAAHLRRAAKVVEAVSRNGGLILFVGTREGQERAVVKAAELAGGYHVYRRWVPGSLTNSTQILGKCRLKVVDDLDQPVPGFENQLFDTAPLKPDLVICLNPLENHAMLHECALNNVPTIGIIDTNANPTWVTYPIPANDDSLRSISLIAGILGRAGEAGRAARLDLARRGLYKTRSTVKLKSRGNLKKREEYPETLMLGSSYKEIISRTKGEHLGPTKKQPSAPTVVQEGSKRDALPKDGVEALES